MNNRRNFWNIQQLLGHVRDLLTRSYKWNKAQLGEYEWWRWLAINGYNGKTRDEFVSLSQRGWLLSQLEILEKPLDSWESGIIVEFGSGPAGFVEYMNAKRKIAVEPLIDKFKLHFPHLLESNVEYWNCPAEDIGHHLDGIADLVICFNMLDHSREPHRVVRKMASVAKPGADLLFQVNVSISDGELRKKSKYHQELHPHSFRPETVRNILQENGFEIRKHFLTEEADANHEHSFICSAVRI